MADCRGVLWIVVIRPAVNVPLSPEELSAAFLVASDNQWVVAVVFELRFNPRDWCFHLYSCDALAWRAVHHLWANVVYEENQSTLSCNNFSFPCVFTLTKIAANLAPVSREILICSKLDTYFTQFTAFQDGWVVHVMPWTFWQILGHLKEEVTWMACSLRFDYQSNKSSQTSNDTILYTTYIYFFLRLRLLLM